MKTRISKLAFFTCCALFCMANVSWAKSVEEKAKKFIDETAGALKQAVDQFGDNVSEIQSYLDHYHWKGVLEDQSTTDPVTLKNLRLNGHDKVVVVLPGERVEGRVTCTYAQEQCAALTYYRIILGIKDQGAQTTIAGTLGAFAGESHEDFVLIAPATRGMYQIAFQPTEALLESTALAQWRDPEGVKPIGFIIVK